VTQFEKPLSRHLRSDKCLTYRLEGTDCKLFEILNLEDLAVLGQQGELETRTETDELWPLKMRESCVASGGTPRFWFFEKPSIVCIYSAVMIPVRFPSYKVLHLIDYAQLLLLQ